MVAVPVRPWRRKAPPAQAADMIPALSALSSPPLHLRKVVPVLAAKSGPCSGCTSPAPHSEGGPCPGCRDHQPCPPCGDQTTPVIPRRDPCMGC